MCNLLPGLRMCLWKKVQLWSVFLMLVPAGIWVKSTYVGSGTQIYAVVSTVDIQSSVGAPVDHWVNRLPFKIRGHSAGLWLAGITAWASRQHFREIKRSIDGDDAEHGWFSMFVCGIIHFKPTHLSLLQSKKFFGDNTKSLYLIGVVCNLNPTTCVK